MDDRKFTPPTEFPAEYVYSNGDKAVILGRGPHKVFPFIGHNAAGYARYWTEKGTFSSLGINGFDLHDIPMSNDLVKRNLDAAHLSIVLVISNGLKL